MKLPRRTFLKVGAGAAVAAATGGCDEMQRGRAYLFGNTSRPVAVDVAPSAAAAIDDVAHVLNRLTFGPRLGDYARVRRLGVHEFIEEQLQPEKIDDTACERVVRRLEVLNAPTAELFEYKEKYLLQEMTRGTLLRAISTERQLFEVMVQFWTDHFNIDPSKGECKWLKAADDRLVIRKHALGKFSDMLRASALSPAMLWYLDGRVNRRREDIDKPNENYARELMELHTLGVDGGYTQRDVMEVARCLTGWTVRDQKRLRKARVEFDAKQHDDGAKEVLGHAIPAGLGEKDIDRVLEIVGYHPSTARYIARKLCRRFISDEPPKKAVEAVADTFSSSSGDIRQTLRTLFAQPEFWSSKGAKLKRPFHYVVSALRAANVETDVGKPVVEALLRMGHAPFRYPTPDGYPEEGSHWTGTLLWRWNFAAALSGNKMKGTRVEPAGLRKALGTDASILAHCFGRQPTEAELRLFQSGGQDLALAFAAPAFQRC
jgi:uncharacterized protein (DUF1800 family)